MLNGRLLSSQAASGFEDWAAALRVDGCYRAAGFSAMSACKSPEVRRGQALKKVAGISLPKSVWLPRASPKGFEPPEEHLFILKDMSVQME